MSIEVRSKKVLGINGLGRMGKLTLWHHLQRGAFGEVVVNLGRSPGRSLQDLLDLIASDSTYGALPRFLRGVHAEPRMRVVDGEKGLLEIEGVPVRVLRTARNPKDVDWRAHGVRVVVDTTGVFLDPVSESAQGSLRGHLQAGAEVVVASAPFKQKDKTAPLPDDAAMLIYGINHTAFDARRHKVLSAASCTTTGLAHLMKPLFEAPPTSRVLTASMSTIHAATNSQSVLDSMPKDGAKDLRKTRATLNNIILSSTGAAGALEEILPAIRQVGFMADAVRVPTATVSLINLNLTFHSPLDAAGQPAVSREVLNGIYRAAAAGPQRGLLRFSEVQNVSSDLAGVPAAVVVEGHETHTRLGMIELTPEMLFGLGVQRDATLRIPVTHAKVFGWYDNEYGSYVCCLGGLTEYLARSVG